MKRKNFEIAISITVLFASILGIAISTYKSEVQLKYVAILVGIFGALVGAISSYYFSKLVKREPGSKVFIAYSFNDKEYADRLGELLSEKKVKVLKEEEQTEIGIDLKKQLEETIKLVDVIVLIISKEFYKSKNLKNVIDISRLLKKKILPITTDNCALPNTLSNLKYYDTSKDSDKATTEIVKQILQST
jgi:hypothetical protein